MWLIRMNSTDVGRVTAFHSSIEKDLEGLQAREKDVETGGRWSMAAGVDEALYLVAGPLEKRGRRYFLLQVVLGKEDSQPLH